MINIALFEPEIPQNVGTIIRLSCCFGLTTHIIEPCGFVWQNKLLKRSGMDYLGQADIKHHDCWETFLKATQNKRLVFLDTQGKVAHTKFSFENDDVIIAGRESNGFLGLNSQKEHSIRIPLLQQQRSLNVATALSIATGEALRQTLSFPS